MDKIKLPKEGIFVGSGVYPTDTDTLMCTMIGHYAWQCQHFSPLEMIDKIIADNQGNLAQVWGYARGFSPRLLAEWHYALDEIGIDIPAPDWDNFRHLTVAEYKDVFENYKSRYGEGLVRFIREAKKRGIYTALLYTDAAEGIPPKMTEFGEWYLGYDFGERYNIGLNDAKRILEASGCLTLGALANGLRERVAEHCDERRRAGWGHIMATSANFTLDYEILGGADIPVVEDFAFPNLNFASGFSRGLYRQHDLPLWGAHLAHEHYSWLPNGDWRRMEELRAGMYLKYMAGAKMIINESGNWFVEHTLSPDSPKLKIPQTAREKFGVIGWGTRELVEKQPEEMKKLLDEARPYFKELDYNSELCKGYRRVISDFWDFVKEHGTPDGQPETTIALAKGNCDLATSSFQKNYALSGLYDIAAENPNWFQGAPEYGWEIARDVFFPCVPVLEPYTNIQLSGTPYGQVDVVSFANNKISAEFLARQYKALLFTGWNTSSAEQYEILKQYVREGGTLFLALPQLSTDETRNYYHFTADDLVNGGDFSELCGLKVLGRGDCIYWAMNAPGKWVDGSTFPRRYGILGVPIGKVEITDPELEVLILDDEQANPVVTVHRYGKGKCYFMNTWAYPGAVDNDDGPGGLTGSNGMIGAVYRMIAAEHRGTVYTTGGTDCAYVAYSYFPESGDICLFNVDFERAHTVTLHTPAWEREIRMNPGEFRRLGKSEIS